MTGETPPAEARDKLKLWFFRDMSDEQRLKLFSLFGLPTDEIGKTHGHQSIALKHVLAALSLPAPGEGEAAKLADRLDIAANGLGRHGVLGIRPVMIDAVDYIRRSSTPAAPELSRRATGLRNPHTVCLIERLRAGLDHTTGGMWKAEGYVVFGDWHASGAIASIRTGPKAFGDTKHIARCSPDNIRALLDALDLATAEHAASRQNFHTMQHAANALRQRVEKAEALLAATQAEILRLTSENERLDATCTALDSYAKECLGQIDGLKAALAPFKQIMRTEIRDEESDNTKLPVRIGFVRAAASSLSLDGEEGA